MIQKALGKFSINNRHYYILKNEYEISSIDLFSELSQADLYPKVYWSHRDDQEARIAFGKILGSYRIPKIKIKTLLEGDSFEPRFYGGRAFEMDSNKKSVFESFKRQYFFLPKYELIQKENQTKVIAYEISSQKLSLKTLSKPTLFNNTLSEELSFKLENFQNTPSFDLWKKQINSLIFDIKSKKLDKAVLARQSTLKLSNPINPYIALKKLQKSFFKSSFFCFEFKKGHAFLGATPECLYSRKNSYLKTEAIAGTANLLKKDLLTSEKELDEFNYVTCFLSKKLKEMSSQLQKRQNKMVNVGYLNHLYSEYEAKLLPKVTDEKIIESLFPSPALSGFPQNKALKKINSLEDFNRHWYASPVGWISESSAQLIIAIRSCLISNQKIYLFVGNGIVVGSDPKKEWDELNTKMQPFLELLKIRTL